MSDNPADGGHLDRWIADVLDWLEANIAQGPFILANVMLDTRIGRPAVEQAMRAIEERRLGWTFKTDAKGPRVIAERAEVHVPFHIERERVGGECILRHDIAISTEERIVWCQRCGRLQDPFDALLAVSKEWTRARARWKSLASGIQDLEEKNKRLLREEANTKARLANARMQLRLLDAR